MTGPLPLPNAAWVDAWNVLHRYHGAVRDCAEAPISGAGIRSLVLLRDPRTYGWCTAPECFGTRRCRVCGGPSEPVDECARCLAASAGKALERAA